VSSFLWVLGLNALLVFFRILYVLFYPIDLSPEEAQYWDWSRRLDLSYYSKPPLVAYFNAVSTALLGNTELGVRINAVLLSAVLSVAVYAFARRVFNGRVALWAALFPHATLGYALNSVLFTTDSPLLFFWGLSVMSGFMAVKTDRLRYWLLTGLFAGLAFLSKYPAVFLLPCALIYFLWSGKRPPKGFFLALAVAFSLGLPVLVWNAKHGFVSFLHVSSLASGKGSGVNWASLLEFIGGQALLTGPVAFVLTVGLWIKSLRSGGERERYFTSFSLPPFLFFLLLSVKKRVYANWAGFSYFAANFLLAERLARAGRALKLSAVGSALLFTLLLHFTPLLDYLGLTKLLPPERDPTKFLVGWEKLGREVSRFYTGKELVFSDRYQIAAELAFYVEGHPRTFVFHVSRMTQYYLWRDELKRYKGRDAIFVSYGAPPRAVLKSFKSKEFLKKVPVYWRGKKVREFYIFKLRGFSGAFYEAPKGY